MNAGNKLPNLNIVVRKGLQEKRIYINGYHKGTNTKHSYVPP